MYPLGIFDYAGTIIMQLGTSTLKPDSSIFITNFIHDLFDEFADIQTEGIFRIQPEINQVDKLERQLQKIFDLEPSSRREGILKIKQEKPSLFETYALSNLLLRYYQHSAVFPIVNDSIDFKALSSWYLFVCKLKIIENQSSENKQQDVIAKATNQTFLVFMGDLLAQGHSDCVLAIHRLLQLIQTIPKQSKHNKMDLEAVAHQFPASFSGMMSLDSMICKDDKVAEWKFVSNMLLSILSRNDFSLSINQVYPKQENITQITEHSIRLQTLFLCVKVVSDWLINGTATQRQKVRLFLVSPTANNIIASAKDKNATCKKKEKSSVKHTVPILNLSTITDFTERPFEKDDSPILLLTRSSSFSAKEPLPLLNLANLSLQTETQDSIKEPSPTKKEKRKYSF